MYLCVCVSVCVCVSFGGWGLGEEAITGPKQGLCVVNLCSANRSLSKGERRASPPPPKRGQIKGQLREEARV